MTAYASFRCARAVFALGAICCVAATAAEPSTVQFHGFIGQSYIHTDRNQFFGHSTGNGHFQFRELGANVSWQAQPNLLFAAQAVSRHAGDGDNGEPRLDYALADYGIVSNEQYSLGMRAGPVKKPFGLYKATKDVPFTRPSILLPQAIYFDRTPNLRTYLDGI